MFLVTVILARSLTFFKQFETVLIVWLFTYFIKKPFLHVTAQKALDSVAAWKTFCLGGAQQFCSQLFLHITIFTFHAPSQFHLTVYLRSCGLPAIKIFYPKHMYHMRQIAHLLNASRCIVGITFKQNMCSVLV